MKYGEEFEVTRDVYQRAEANGGFMASEDKPKYFSDAILIGYGLYGCMVREEGGRYLCSYMIGSSCD